MKIKLTIFLIFLTFAVNIKAQDANYDATIARGIKEIYNIQFNEAEVTFKKLISNYPDHPSGRFFLAMIEWWKIMLDVDNEQYDDLFFQKLEDVIFQCDELLKKNPNNEEALFFKGGSIGYRGRLRAFRESWIKAADDGREALPIVEKAAEINPKNMDVQLGFGLYNYYAAVIPDQYPLVKPLMIFFPKGDKQKGIEQLDMAAKQGKYTKYEAKYFLMTLYYSYENNLSKAKEYGLQLVNDFPNNPTFQKWYGRIFAKERNYVEAAKIFKNVIEKADKGMNGYKENRTIREAAYYVAYQAKNENKLDSAKIMFQMCENYSRKADRKEPSGFLINSLLYGAMMNDATGNRDEAVKKYKEILDMKEYGSSHSLAKQYLQTPYRN